MDYEPINVRIIGAKLKPGAIVEYLKGEITTIGSDCKPTTEVIEVHPGALTPKQEWAIHGLYQMKRFKVYVAECVVVYSKDGVRGQTIFKRWRTMKQVENCEA